MKKKVLPIFLCVLAVCLLVLVQFNAPANAAGEKAPFVTDSSTTAEAVLEAWNSGNYSYVKLGVDLVLPLSGEEILVDLAGKNLTVSGSGRVEAFDTANDTYDHTVCGTLTVNDSVIYDGDCTAPSGIRYIALTDGNRSTLHRFDMKLTSASLRLNTAGIYYKATFACDRLMQEKIQSYGVAVSAKSMPGANFATADDVMYTVISADEFVNGATVTSGIINNILKVDSENNAVNLKTRVYAKVYVNIDGNYVLGTNGYGASLLDVMNIMDTKYASCDDIVKGQLDEFYKKWLNEGAGWSFANIGKSASLDFAKINAKLSLDADSKARCEVCNKVVTWTPVDGSSRVVTTNGGHYYLTKDVNFTDSSVSSFIAAPGTGGHKACFHLNDHNITATAAKAIYGSSGVLNMMGNGTVSGYSAKTDEGAVFYSNNRNASNGFNLYGGTYKRNDGLKTTIPVIAFGGNGRAMNIYDGATVDGGTGTAIVFGGESAREKQGFFNFYGCTINGTVKIGAFNTYVTNVKFVGTTINGTLTIPEGQNIIMSGKVTITDLVVPEGLTFNTKGLKEGTSIKVTATGVFTEPTGSAASYIGYFAPANAADKICVRDGALCSTKDYTSNLKFAEGTSDAYCAVCDKVVTWTAIDQQAANEASGKDYAYQMADKGHYYLAEDITYTGTATYAFLRAAGSEGQVSCFHLNGNDLTCTQRGAFYSGSGVLNVMGNGVVTGHSKSASYGAILHTNNKNAKSSMNFYGGYYTSDESVADAAVIKFGASAGRIYFSEDAVIDGTNATYAVYMSVLNDEAADAVLDLKNVTVKGDIYTAGAENVAASYYTINLDNVDIQGTFKGVGDNSVNLYNRVKIDLLDIEEKTMVVLEGLEDGSDITVKNVGVFAYPSSDAEFADEAETYVDYFKTEWINDKIVFKDEVFVYKTNYEMRLQLDGNNKAWCPVCMEYATWTELTVDETTGRASLQGGHYYLAADINSNYEGTSSAPGLIGTSKTERNNCLHLNGHNITANKAIAIYGSQDGLNIMGSGTVKAYGHGTKPGAVAHINNKNNDYGIRLYSGTYESLSSKHGVLSLGNGSALWIYEDAVVGKVGNTGPAIDTGDANGNDAALYIYDATINGNVNIPGAAGTFTSTVYTKNAEIKGTVSVAGVNDVVFSGRTIINRLDVAEGCLVDFENMLGGSAIKVNAVGTFTKVNDKIDAWASYFIAVNSSDWVIVRDKALFQGERVEVTIAEDADVEKLLAGYGDRVAKYGEMHNHTSAGLTADGRRTLVQWKERMMQLGMDFATIVDHKQVAHMYHKDWQNEPTEDAPVVFVGGSEPGTTISEMIAGTQGNMHYNMITADPQKLVDLVKQVEEMTGKDFYAYEKPYADANWGANGTNNKNKDFVWSDYNEPDGKLDRFYYPKFTRTEFSAMVELFYNVGALIVEVHPDYPSYIKSTDPMDYCFAGDAGSATSPAMGFEITTGGYGRKPSDTYNEQAYQLWLKMLDAGKKVYATYGDDGHRLPTAVAMTTAYAPENANAAYYMQLMHDGNFAPGWVGIRMMVGDTQMGGTADTFEGQRLVFSIGDMYQANEYSRVYLDKSLKPAVMTWEPGYDPTCTYTVRLYDDSGLLQESVVNPGDEVMDYYAIDADADAKFYRIEVWVEKLNDDGTVAYRYRCGVGNPIWNAAAYATAE